MDPMEKLIDLLPREVSKNLNAMSKTNDLEQKKIYSEIVLNLCESMGVFIDALDMAGFDDEDDDFLFSQPPVISPEPKKKSKKKR
ncbi:MAG: hypothetical protein JEZ11_11460 [Desulfobacterales bacterium]|nr:hypothetical protein [Desulfobacterales bacterium]